MKSDEQVLGICHST